MESRNLRIKVIQTDVIHGATLFNAGIRKPTDSFRTPHFVECLSQALLFSISLKNAWVLIGGDGRTYSKDVIERIIRVLAGNSVRKVIVGLNGYLPTSVSACILRNKYCHFGFVISGGHHHPGDNGYLGLKMISPPGSPMRSDVLDKANRIIKVLQSYSTCEKIEVNLSAIGEVVSTVSGRKFSIEVIDIVSPYMVAVKEMFDLPSIKEYIQLPFKIMINCSNGVTGPVVKGIFVDALGVSDTQILNSVSQEDFGQFSADPSPVTCEEFVNLLQDGDEEAAHFGAIISPDGCRCMIIGHEGFVVSPSDSLAIIAAHHQCIPFFRENKLQMIVRTICTSQAVDKVADSLHLLRLEVPVGWDNFSIAMLPAKGKATLFGEESYGLGVSSDSFSGGDRDGVWTVLAWLSIMSTTGKGVKEITEEHWRTYGRSFFGRLDFPNIPHQLLDAFLCFLRETNSLRFSKIKSGNSAHIEYIDPIGIDPTLQMEEAKKHNTEIVFDIENYVYPYGFIKKSLLRNDQYQCYQIHLMEEARLVLRRSESTLNSPTLHFYVEYKVEPENEKTFDERQVVLQPFIQAALKITKIEDFIPPEITPIFI